MWLGFRFFYSSSFPCSDYVQVQGNANPKMGIDELRSRWLYLLDKLYNILSMAGHGYGMELQVFWNTVVDHGHNHTGSIMVVIENCSSNWSRPWFLLPRLVGIPHWVLAREFDFHMLFSRCICWSKETPWGMRWL